MKRSLKFLTTFLLLFNACGALYGGYNLIKYPDGSSVGLSLTLLKHSVFDNYLIPGIILFVCNGLYGIVVSVAVLFNISKNGILVIFQGCILSGWIVIQLMLIRTFSPFHIVLGITGISLIILGFTSKSNGRTISPLS